MEMLVALSISRENVKHLGLPESYQLKRRKYFDYHPSDLNIGNFTASIKYLAVFLAAGDIYRR